MFIKVRNKKFHENRFSNSFIVEKLSFFLFILTLISFSSSPLYEILISDENMKVEWNITG